MRLDITHSYRLETRGDTLGLLQVGRIPLVDCLRGRGGARTCDWRARMRKKQSGSCAQRLEDIRCCVSLPTYACTRISSLRACSPPHTVAQNPKSLVLLSHRYTLRFQAFQLRINIAAIHHISLSIDELTCETRAFTLFFEKTVFQCVYKFYIL